MQYYNLGAVFLIYPGIQYMKMKEKETRVLFIGTSTQAHVYLDAAIKSLLSSTCIMGKKTNKSHLFDCT